jgi:ribonuclease HII
VSPPGRAPRLDLETTLRQQGHALVAGMDEVGRGCLSGPVTVGVVVINSEVSRPPRGLRDSKLLTPGARRALVPRITRWVLGSSVAHASAAEIDAIGIIAALRLAGHRALAALPVRPDCVLLDGNHNYLAIPAAQLSFELDEPPADAVYRVEPRRTASAVGMDDLLPDCPPVRTQIKADLRCASVAAASVLAKTTRDALMEGLAREHPAYGWEINKGYATPYHRAALREYGASPYHRVSWHLGLDDAITLPDGAEDDEGAADAEDVDEIVLDAQARVVAGGQNGHVMTRGRSQEVRA